MPKISANKLAEMLTTASPTRRRRIIHDQKHPAEKIVALYHQAKKPVVDFLTEGRDEQRLREACRQLRADSSGSDWARQDRANTAEALDRFLEMANELPMDVSYAVGPNDPAKLLVAGVAVSVRPDFVISFERRGKQYSGAVKLHLIKNAESALKKTGAEYVSVLLHEWLKQYGPSGCIPAHSHCFSVDVFRGAVVEAPRSMSRRWDDITAICEDIAARWPQL